VLFDGEKKKKERKKKTLQLCQSPLLSTANNSGFLIVSVAVAFHSIRNKKIIR